LTRETFYRWIDARLIALARVYFTLLFGWAILHFVFGDRWAWLFLFNTFAGYLFAPLPIILFLAWKTRRREIWIASIIAASIALFLYGELLLPKFAPNTNRPSLSVMTYNMLGYNTAHPEVVIATIRHANADVVAIQELNMEAGALIQRELARDYPYQILDPQIGVSGAGVLSRFPLRDTGETLPGEWIGTPQILTLDWNGKPVTLLHVHTFPSNASPIAFLLVGNLIEESIRVRENHSRLIADFARAHPDSPLVVTGDFNATDQNTSYQLVAGVLRDSWREAGWGLGHTFPSNNLNTRPTLSVAGLYPMMWLVRIDYIFHSSHWRAVSAELGNWDGFSDHRPVIVKLVLEK
jgi:endonuclease/exonuclease/phosphatase (EEP) superfamily protein YafD